MPVYYDIDPDLNLVVYVCNGPFIASEFFKTGDKVAFDPRLRPLMNIIIDASQAYLEVSIFDLHFALEKSKESKRMGKEIGRTAVLTKSSSLNFLAEAFKLMSPEAPSNFGIFNTQKDVIRWLDLPEEAVHRFWQQLKEQARSNQP